MRAFTDDEAHVNPDLVTVQDESHGDHIGRSVSTRRGRLGGASAGGEEARASSGLFVRVATTRLRDTHRGDLAEARKPPARKPWAYQDPLISAVPDAQDKVKRDGGRRGFRRRSGLPEHRIALDVMAKYFRAFGDPTRLRIMQLLAT